MKADILALFLGLRFHCGYCGTKCAYNIESSLLASCRAVGHWYGARHSSSRTNQSCWTSEYSGLKSLRCPKCGEPMRIIAFVLDRPTIERILAHIGEPTQPPEVLPARSPPQLEFGFDQTIATDDWPEMDQTAGRGAGGWE